MTSPGCQSDAPMLAVRPLRTCAKDARMLVEERMRLGRLAARDDDPELLAAEPGDHADRVDALADHRGPGAQRLVSRRVSVGVVQKLELVDVEHGDGRDLTGPGGDLDGAGEERAPVRHLGQLVGRHEDREASLSPTAQLDLRLELLGALVQHRGQPEDLPEHRGERTSGTITGSP